MSKYIKQVDGKEIVYGSDRSLGYFFQVFDTEDGEEKFPLIDRCETLSRMTHAEMIELMSMYKLPESHIEMVAMDKPIM